MNHNVITLIAQVSANLLFDVIRQERRYEFHLMGVRLLLEFQTMGENFLLNPVFNKYQI